jgi:hypothetical protein
VEASTIVMIKLASNQLPKQAILRLEAHSMLQFKSFVSQTWSIATAALAGQV